MNFIEYFAFAQFKTKHRNKKKQQPLNKSLKLFLGMKQVSKHWNILALDGSNWQKIDLFYFQMDIEVSTNSDIITFTNLYFSREGSSNREHFTTLRWLFEVSVPKRVPERW